MYTFLVGTGIVSFRIDAKTPRQSIEILKERIRARRHQSEHSTIGMSLVTALEQNRLDFIVLDASRTVIFGGEFNGEYHQPPTRTQAEQMQVLVSPVLLSALNA